jgi:elongation factor Tu
MTTVPATDLLPRTKTHFNVGVIGHGGHGKTMLTAAITQRQAHRFGGRALTYDDFLKHGRLTPDGARILTVELWKVSYQTAHRQYAHFDCPGHPRYTKNALTGIAQMDAAILVVWAESGSEPQTFEQALLARRMGVPGLVVFLNHPAACDDGELLDIAERELREELHRAEWPGDDLPIVRGSALAAFQAQGTDAETCRCIDALLATLDACPVPRREVEGPFLMTVDDVFSIRGRGTVATGKVERGSVRVGDPVEIVGLAHPTRATRITEIKMFDDRRDRTTAGDHIGALLRGIERHQVRRGHLLAGPGTVTAQSQFTAPVQLVARKDGGRRTPIFSGYRPQLHVRTADVPVTLALSSREMCFPGESDEVTVKLDPGWTLCVEPGQPFVLRDDNRVIGSGVVVALR